MLRLRGRSDPAGLPLAAGIFAIVWFMLMPFVNAVVRTTESEADAFGLNAAREPQGFASAAMRLSTYRKLQPGEMEEFLFYDHPSGYERVRRSMLWPGSVTDGTPIIRPSRVVTPPLWG